MFKIFLGKEKMKFPDSIFLKLLTTPSKIFPPTSQRFFGMINDILIHRDSLFQPPCLLWNLLRCLALKFLKLYRAINK